VEGRGYTKIPHWISTGALNLDAALGGGIAGGRICELYSRNPSEGKSTLAGMIARECQKLGGSVVYADMEQTLSEEYFKDLGVNVGQRFLLSRPESLEELFSFIEFIGEEFRPKDPTNPLLVVVDSVAAAQTKAQHEATFEDRQVAEQARAISAGLRKLTPIITRDQITLLLVNQARTRIGICFDYLSKVNLADGRKEFIGKLVNNKIPAQVLTVNEKTGKVEVRKIQQWHRTVYRGDFIDIRLNGGKNGWRGFRATPEHPIFVPDGWKKAGDLRPGDMVIVAEPTFFSSQQHEIILGSILGDGSLRFEKNGPCGHLRLGHCKEQEKYCDWKARILNTKIHKEQSGKVWANTKRGYEFQRYRNIQKKKGLVHIPDEWIEALTPRVFAVWYMDDGTFSGSYMYWGNGKAVLTAKLLSEVCLKKIADKAERLGLGRPSYRVGKGWLWSGEESGKFQRGVAPYFCPFMWYKLKPENRFPVQPVKKQKDAVLSLVSTSVISSKRVVLKPRGHSKNVYRYDIGIGKEHHNYFVDGVLVHNSYGDPDDTPGGRALKYYASQRIVLTKGKKLTAGKDEDEQAIGIEVKAHVIKNKVGPPFRKAMFKLYFGKGVDYADAAFDLAVSRGVVIEESKGYYTHVSRGGKFRRADFQAVLNARPDLQDELKKLVFTSVSAKEQEEKEV